MNKEQLKTIIKKLFILEIIMMASLLVIIGNTANIAYLGFFTLAAVAGLVYLILFCRDLRKVNGNFKRFYWLEFANAIGLIGAGIVSMVPGTAGHFMLGACIVLHAIGYMLIGDYYKKGIIEFLELDEEEIKFHKGLYVPFNILGLVLVLTAFLSPFDFVTGTLELQICFGIAEMVCACAGPILFIFILKASSNDIDNPHLLTKEKEDDVNQ